MPYKPWQELRIDFCGPFPTEESLLVCGDACTRWPEVVILVVVVKALQHQHP